MKFFPLVWKNLWRRKVRTIFTLASIFVAFVLFGLLMTIRAAFSFGIDLAGLDRLVLIHKVSLIQPLPVSYLPRLAQVPGVELATHNSWFGGIYQTPSNFFAVGAWYEDFQPVSDDEVRRLLAEASGAVEGGERSRTP